MENLSTAYDAIDLLTSLGLPISSEQLQQVKDLEQQYINDVIVPHIKQECEPLLEEILGGCHLIISYSKENGLEIHTPTVKDTYTPRNESYTFNPDRTKYSINGGPALPKRRCVLKVIQEYVKDHPNISFYELERVFPDEYAGGGYCVVGIYDNVKKKYDSMFEFGRRYFIEEADAIYLSDGTRVVVSNQWGASGFENFLNLARRYYSNIQPVL